MLRQTSAGHRNKRLGIVVLALYQEASSHAGIRVVPPPNQREYANTRRPINIIRSSHSLKVGFLYIPFSLSYLPEI